MAFADQTYAGWGFVHQATAPMARPERDRDLSPLVAGTEKILPVGGLRSYGDAALAKNGAALRTERLDRFLAFDSDTGVLEVEAGARLGDILAAMAPQGWMPAVLPGTGFTTVGGAIANDVHGKNHHVVGSFGQHLESFELIDPDGHRQWIDATTQPQLFRATVGGVGQTGLVARAKLKLMRCDGRAMVVREDRIPNLTAFLERFESDGAPYQVGWIDTLAKDDHLGRGIFEAADFAPAGAKVGKPPKPRAVPMMAPSFLLSAPIVRAFNAAYRRRVPNAGRNRICALQQFFFPLDGIADWNRLYGKAGFHQFQCVVPLGSAGAGLRSLLTEIAEAGIASPLAVIKKTGPGRAGYMSFPMEGITLAVDLPNRLRTGKLLAELNRIALDHGGRVYLAKDSSADRDTIAAMYSEKDAYAEAVAKADPEAKFLSQMAQRLDLRGRA